MLGHSEALIVRAEILRTEHVVALGKVMDSCTSLRRKVPERGLKVTPRKATVP